MAEIVDSGFIKLWRTVKNWQWFQTGDTFKVFMYLICEARVEDGYSLGVFVERGQAITGRKKIAKACGVSEKSVRTCLERLKSTNEIATKSTNKFTIITIIKYEDYQGYPQERANKKANTSANKGPTKGQQRANKGPLTKNEKNDKNEKNGKKKDIYGEYRHVTLSEEEMAKLNAEYGETLTQQAITYLDEYTEMKGYKCKSCYLAMKKWVFSAIEEKAEKSGKKDNRPKTSNPFLQMLWEEEEKEKQNNGQKTGNDGFIDN